MSHRLRNPKNTIAKHPKTSVIKTNLYDIVEAVSEEVPNGNDRIISTIVSDILKTAAGIHCKV